MAKKRNTIEDYLHELYRQGLAGDEETCYSCLPGALPLM